MVFTKGWTKRKQQVASKSKPGKSKTKKSNTQSTPSASQSEIEEEEIEQPVKPKQISKHKSFGKFRCLLETQSNADSSLDTETETAQNEKLEQQTDVDLYDSLLIDSNSQTAVPISMDYAETEGESVEIIATEISHQLSDLHVYNENEGDYFLDRPIPADDMCEQDVEIPGSDVSDRNASIDLEENISTDETIDKKLSPKMLTNKKTDKRTTKKAKKNGKKNQDTPEYDNIRRSVRIKCKETSKEELPKSITKLKKNGKNNVDSETSNSSFADSEKIIDCPSINLPIPEYDSDNKPVKVKSRWRRSSELEMESSLKHFSSDLPLISEVKKQECDDPLLSFVELKENLYLTPKVICKEAKKMTCDCVLTSEEIAKGEFGCGDDCLNRLLMIECGELCPVNENCSNKKFQKCEYAPCEVFSTDKKGCGIRAITDIPYGHFILEYIGEVIGPDEFEERATDYSKDKNPHHYFMALRADAVIDATAKGNISRFINHSCDPNAETQKWTVNGELRIGFFSKRTILEGEEITFDYQFQRYGKDAQKCLCEAPSCRGWLGAEPDEDADEDEEEEEVEEATDVQEEAHDVKPEEPPKIVKSVEEKPPLLKTEAIDVPATATEAEDVTMLDVTSLEPPVVPEVKKIIKKEKKKIVKRKVRKEIIFENVDVDGEIEMLVQSGLKNQAHTLKLSRLMVRATEVSQRSSLLRILRRGELPCRRLFLDYHGLRLIYGWMNDAQQLCKSDKKRESLRLELLQTLATLPIPNKTMLQDSKVLPTIEKWSNKLEENIPGTDSESNSPKTEMDTNCEAENVQEDKPESTLMITTDFQIQIRETKDIRKSVGMDRDCRRMKSIFIPRKRGKEFIQDIIDLFDDDLDEEEKKRNAKQDVDYEVEIIALALKLLEEWTGLKEVFRIPKKERIEQMKEHEREADRIYKSNIDHSEVDNTRSERSNLYYSRYNVRKIRNTKPEYPDRNRKHIKTEDNNPLKHINKHERRKLFAMQVEQRDMWRQQELQRMSLNSDPRYTPSYDNRNMHSLWQQPAGQWPPSSPVINQNRFFNYNTPNLTSMPPPPLLPQPNMAPYSPSPTLNITQIALNNISRTNQLPPVQVPNVQPPATNLSAALANFMSLPGISSQLSSISQTLANLPQTTPQSSAPRLPNLHSVLGLPTLQPQEAPVEEDISQVKFAGPIPPPVKLPPKWKCAKDKYGRPYYYHIRNRISQWEPPEFLPPPPVEYEEETESSSSSSSSTSEASSSEGSDDEEEDEDDDLADNKLLLQIRKKFEQAKSSPIVEKVITPKPPKEQTKIDAEIASECLELSKTSSLDERLQQEFNLPANAKEALKHQRQGLVTDIRIISPRSEEDKILAKENLRKYKQNKQRLKHQKETKIQLSQASKRHTSTVKAKVKDLMYLHTDDAKKIKDSFRNTMANNMVTILNPYTKRDCKQGRITSSEDFKHLAKKLTVFVMLKQLKSCDDIEELKVTESVKSKAKVFVKKYMSKFGESYIRPKDDGEYDW